MPLPKRKPHENGVLTKSELGETWSWTATPAEARVRYAETIERASDLLEGNVVLIQLVEMGQVVDEMTLGRDQNSTRSV